MSPVIIHHTHTEEDADDFEAVMYDDEKIDCVLSLHPADRHDSRVRYVDDKLRLVEPTLKVRATAVVHDHFINPIIAILMALAVMASTAWPWAAAGTAWRMIPISIRQWCKWIIITLTLSVIMAAIGIHAWHNANEHQNTAAAPDVAWYSRDEDYMMRRANENRTRTIDCATTQMASRSRVHTFVAFDKLGNRYRVGVDSYAEISMIHTVQYI